MNRLAVALAACSVFCQSVSAVVYDESRIRTWTYPVSGWNMVLDRYKTVTLYSGIPFADIDIIEAKVLIFSDGGDPQAYNLARSSPQYPNAKAGGGFTFLTMKAGGGPRFIATLDRGPCSRSPIPSGSGTFLCNDPARPDDVDNFFVTKYNSGRQFTGLSGVRALLKVDYVCTACPSQTIKSYYRKLGPLNMGTQPSSRYDLSGASIGIGRVVDQSVTVHSDPEPNPAIGDPYGAPIHADNFEHVGSDKAATWFPNGDNSQTGVPIESFPNYRHRGGVLWQGYGCDGSFANAFPTLDWTRSKCGSSPTPSPRALHLSYGAQSVFTSGTYRYQEDILPLTYNRTDINRGWIKIEYSGTQSASKVPYCMRTKAISIGTWKAGERNADGVPRYPSIEIPLSNLGISADRISKMTAALISDKGYYCEGCVEGTTVNDFSAPSSISGMNHAQVGDAENMSGGDFYIDGKRNRMILQWHRASTVGMGLFGRYNFTGPDNRGFIRVDYLAGNCEEGLANFSVKTIPSPNTGACTGTSSTTVPIHIEGSGAGLATGATADEVTYVYHTLSASNKTVEVKINNQDALTDRYGIAGIMIRSSLNANATHVSAVVASKYNSSTSGRITACGRLTTGGGNETFSTNGQAPVWLRIQKLGGAFYVKYSYNHSTWTNLYSYGVGNFPSTYYVGFIVANSTNPRLSKPEFQYFAEL